jgi:hypothetical protein
LLGLYGCEIASKSASYVLKTPGKTTRTTRAGHHRIFSGELLAA